jgi:hypothetical protein
MQILEAVHLRPELQVLTGQTVLSLFAPSTKATLPLVIVSVGQRSDPGLLGTVAD